MKKLITGAVCTAAIAAAAVVLLPVAAAKIAVGLSKPRAGRRTDSRHAGSEAPSGRLLPEQNRGEAPLSTGSPVKS